MIFFNCPSCHVEIKAKPKRAGTHGRCPKCASDLTIPDANRTEVDEAESIAEPYELKGDRLGMSLEEFMAKHQQTTVDTSESGLFCSGVSKITHGPSNECDPTTGLINCIIDSGTIGRPSPPATVAGVPTEFLLYHFVEVGAATDNDRALEIATQQREIATQQRDFQLQKSTISPADITKASLNWASALESERLASLRRAESKRLYQISAFVNARYTRSVHDALAAKYGECNEQEGTTWVWDNGLSVIALFQQERASDNTQLTFSHKELRLLAETRERGPAVQDL